MSPLLVFNIVVNFFSKGEGILCYVFFRFETFSFIDSRLRGENFSHMCWSLIDVLETYTGSFILYVVNNGN